MSFSFSDIDDFVSDSLDFSWNVMGGGYLRDLYQGGAGNDFLGDPFGVQAGKDADAANAKSASDIGSLYANASKEARQGYGSALQTQRMATAEVRKGVGKARQGLANAGNTARSGILAREQETLAADEARQFGRGFSSPALLSATRRAHAYDTNTALSSVDEAIGSLLSSLELQGSQAIAGSLGREGALKMGGTSGLGDLASAHASALGGIQHTSSGGWATDLLPLLALAAV